MSSLSDQAPAAVCAIDTLMESERAGVGRRIGLHRATDLAGGYMAWKALTS